MNKLSFIFAFVLLGSCAYINTDYRNEMNQKKQDSFRHGVIPASTNTDYPKTVYSKESAMRGKMLYESHCLSCHGVKGNGNGTRASSLPKRPANLVDLTKEVPSFKFYMMVSQWKGEMPGWSNVFSDKETRDIENYIHSLRNL